MSNVTLVNLAYEDELSEHVLRLLLSRSGRNYQVATCYSGGGFGYLRKRVRGFNNAAKGIPFLVLTDLDTAACPPELIQDWLPATRHPNLLLRVAVREVESWLLADRENLARFLGVAVEMVPQNSDSIADPKSTLVNLARKSRRGELRADIVPRPGSTSKQGPSYNGRLIAFVENNWDPVIGSTASVSLRRTMEALASFVPV